MQPSEEGMLHGVGCCERPHKPLFDFRFKPAIFMHSTRRVLQAREVGCGRKSMMLETEVCMNGHCCVHVESGTVVWQLDINS